MNSLSAIIVHRNMSFKFIVANLAPCNASEMVPLNRMFVATKYVSGESESDL